MTGGGLYAINNATIFDSNLVNNIAYAGTQTWFVNGTISAFNTYYTPCNSTTPSIDTSYAVCSTPPATLSTTITQSTTTSRSTTLIQNILSTSSTDTTVDNGINVDDQNDNGHRNVVIGTTIGLVLVPALIAITAVTVYCVTKKKVVDNGLEMAMSTQPQM